VLKASSPRLMVVETLRSFLTEYASLWVSRSTDNRKTSLHFPLSIFLLPPVHSLFSQLTMTIHYERRVPLQGSQRNCLVLKTKKAATEREKEREG
jgi:hypothetical protein